MSEPERSFDKSQEAVENSIRHGTLASNVESMICIHPHPYQIRLFASGRIIVQYMQKSFSECQGATKNSTDELGQRGFIFCPVKGSVACVACPFFCDLSVARKLDIVKTHKEICPTCILSTYDLTQLHASIIDLLSSSEPSVFNQNAFADDDSVSFFQSIMYRNRSDQIPPRIDENSAPNDVQRDEMLSLINKLEWDEHEYTFRKDLCEILKEFSFKTVKETLESSVQRNRSAVDVFTEVLSYNVSEIWSYSQSETLWTVIKRIKDQVKSQFPEALTKTSERRATFPNFENKTAEIIEFIKCGFRLCDGNTLSCDYCNLKMVGFQNILNPLMEHLKKEPFCPVLFSDNILAPEALQSLTGVL